jgi:hypothetical protein
MEIRKRGVLVMSAPALGAFLLGAVLLGGIVPNTTDKLGEEMMEATGYVTVSVIRDGNEIYHYEDHNLITDAGRDFILQQIGGTADTATAQFIGLSSDTNAPAADDTELAGEIDNGGLARSQGTFEQGTGDDADSFTITETFNATAAHSGVQKAGLFTASSGGTMVAENEFSSVNLANGDQLTITWRVDLGLTPAP